MPNDEILKSIDTNHLLESELKKHFKQINPNTWINEQQNITVLITKDLIQFKSARVTVNMPVNSYNKFLCLRRIINFYNTLVGDTYEL